MRLASERWEWSRRWSIRSVVRVRTISDMGHVRPNVRGRPARGAAEVSSSRPKSPQQMHANIFEILKPRMVSSLRLAIEPFEPSAVRLSETPAKPEEPPNRSICNHSN